MSLLLLLTSVLPLFEIKSHTILPVIPTCSPKFPLPRGRILVVSLQVKIKAEGSKIPLRYARALSFSQTNLNFTILHKYEEQILRSCILSELH